MMLQANYSKQLWFLVLIKKLMFAGLRVLDYLIRKNAIVFKKAHKRSQAWNLKKEKTKGE